MDPVHPESAIVEQAARTSVKYFILFTFKCLDLSVRAGLARKSRVLEVQDQ